MSDEKEGDGIDFEGQLAKIINQKSRKRNNNDIYERFINRVHGSEENDQSDFETLESSKNLAAFEPLSTEELQLFEDQSSEQELLLETEETTITDIPFEASGIDVLSENDVVSIDNDSDNSSVDAVSANTKYSEHITSNNDAELASAVDYGKSTNTVSDDDSSDIEGTSESIVEAPVIKNEAIKKKLIIKPAIIIMAVGLIIFVAIVLVLVLSTSNVDHTESSANGNVAIESASTVHAEPILSTDSQTTMNDAGSASEQSATTQQSVSDDNKQDMPAASESELNLQSSTPEDDDTTIATEEATITYEDFRQESQTTLYREIKD
ncbi:hypothetical protein ACT3QR_05875 [Psychrobacter sp. AOP7-B1-25]|uniref:hypothetical protein n=1 Tax=Psychrobacter sp. AOP7-B1-25 TaxID=3457644 RepID=UPI00402B77EC